MANGIYGTKRPAQVTSDDVEIFYSYRPTRSSDDADFIAFKKLESNKISPSMVEEGSKTVNLPGMYDLRLPLDEFGKKGIYTIYIKPKEIHASILDADARLAAYSDIRGIVIDTTTINSELANNGNLVGYRVEYFSTEDNETRTGEYRIITSNNRCEPVAQSFTDSSQKGIRYKFNDASNLIFCTLTPSSSLPFKANSIPGIGQTGQEIVLINTKFNPVALEIEMVDHDADTISTMLEGVQLRNLDKGIITTFTPDGGIYHQADYGNITNPSKGVNHDFRLPKEKNILFTEEEILKDIKDNI